MRSLLVACGLLFLPVPAVAGCAGCGDDYVGVYDEKEIYLSNFSEYVVVGVDAVPYSGKREECWHVGSV